MADTGDNEKKPGLKAHKMPEQSVFFDRVMPVLFVLLGVVMVGLIVFAIGVLIGVVQWS